MSGFASILHALQTQGHTCVAAVVMRFLLMLILTCGVVFCFPFLMEVQSITCSWRQSLIYCMPTWTEINQRGVYWKHQR